MLDVVGAAGGELKTVQQAPNSRVRGATQRPWPETRTQQRRRTKKGFICSRMDSWDHRSALLLCE